MRTQVRISTPGRAALAQGLADAGERGLQVALDVVGQRLQRRNVDHLRRIGEAAFQALAEQSVDGGQKCSQRLARSGRRGDQRMAAGLDRRPGLHLCRGRRRKAFGEPCGDGGVKQGGQGHAQDGRCGTFGVTRNW